MKIRIGFLLILICLPIIGFRISKGIEFKQNVTGYLKRAADANTIELANEELKKALDFLEENDLTSGYTSILYQTPDEDISFWYRNLKASQQELQNLKAESALEKTNVLMKLRETLLDVDEDTDVTVPEGIAVYPHNKFWAALMTFALLALCTGFVMIAVEYDKIEKERLAKAAQEKA